jgi:REP element-mobilizing transposase RayT
MSGTLCSIVQNFKSVSTRKINHHRITPGCPVWQRNYYERVIRNEHELSRAREYIVINPMQWALDRENPLIHP